MKIFSGTAWVELQGKRPMRLVQVAKNYAQYQLTGFKHPVIIRDYRRRNLPLIRQVQITGNPTGFADHFNTPAHVKIQRQKPSRIVIQLHDVDDTDPAYRLWIAVGIKNRIPVYDYLFERLARLDNDRLAFLALYRRKSESESTSSDS